MKYSIIDTNKGEKVGFQPILHRLLKNGEKMVVNENELRRIGEDIELVAINLGGTLLTYGEMLKEVNKLINN